MVERKAFLKAYNIDEDDFKAADISWEELAAIYDDYLSKEEKLRGIGKDFVNDYLYDIERAGIHSYRYRTKNPGHLLEKIIRKRKEDPEKFKDLNRNNYYKYMTDLIGIRVFFLYREDLQSVLPAGLSKDDSLLFAEHYIRNWVEDILLYDKAQSNIPNNGEIDKLVENYRKALIMHTYQQALIHQRLLRGDFRTRLDGVLREEPGALQGGTSVDERLVHQSSFDSPAAGQCSSLVQDGNP